MKLWRVVQETELKELPTSSLEAEYILEDWIAKDSSLLGMELLMIGRQVTTDFGGRIDLLAIDRQGDITIIELKRDRTPRDIVAQVLDYASWIRRLSYKDLDSIASAYIKKDLSSAFVEFFDEAIPENINVNHKMLIVASEFDDSSQRIVEYLAEEYQVNINAIFFSIFTDDQGKLVGRAWLMDPEDVQDRAESRKQAPWSGFWFVNVGEGLHRNWDDNVKYGYIGAGQGPKYSDPLKKLKEGDPIFAYMKGLGYVGFGIVREPAKMVKDFVVETTAMIRN
jgi:ribosomal protein L30E